ncbi:T-cell activation inhibitor, mitochondrial [Condylostylus longicornis]|uniref:T-cell activation inhibitor, mitochondrial n=1 Tax=Condylostylus longicornis TaxID=2530218 RepID=UPI00244DACCA|nr:T-cell activation inhibitor, mitochondrial [Condylostylus longicornis]XP_055386141.1 T-cell activation inhibitor, mitochondrial [Condylostylus longicornis]
MFNYLLKNNIRVPQSIQWQRLISSAEIATALRPFYFAVHPDLFGRHPEQRTVNEESLKHLSAHLEAIQQRRLAQSAPKTLTFYIRDKQIDRDSFKLVKISLERNSDVKFVIKKLLQSVNLSTEFVDKIKSSNISKLHNVNANGSHQTQQKHQDVYYSDFQNYEYEFRKSAQQVEKTLVSWLSDNGSTARERDKDLQELKEEVIKLQKSLAERLKLKELRYDCGWNYEHYRGCLKTLERLANMYEKETRMLQGRVVVFAPFTGVSLEGHVMLFTGDVLSSWLDFIKNIPKHDIFLEKIPKYESALSQVLLNIKIRRRKFMPKRQVVEYAGYLSKITTTLLDYLTTKKFPKSWPNDLSNFEIVIESEAGPLMISPTGQIITPATCPGFMLIDFITTNLDEARQKAETYKRTKHIEKELHKNCIDILKLKSLTKDDSVTPEKMIKCLERLLKCGLDTKLSENIHLNITNYYSVLHDGTVNIPWDFTVN